MASFITAEEGSVTFGVNLRAVVCWRGGAATVTMSADTEIECEDYDLLREAMGLDLRNLPAQELLAALIGLSKLGRL